MKLRILSALAALLLLAACAAPMTPDLAKEARRIAKSSIIVDTHIDAPIRLHSRPADISKATKSGDFDYPRALIGGLNAPFMSIYTPARLEASGGSKQLAEELVNMVEGFVATSPDKFALATSPSQVREQFDNGIISLAMGMENGSPIEGKLENLQHFFDRGIRYITLAHSLSNHIADSSYDKNRPWKGLSEFGVSVVEEMNRLGIMVDISHVSDDAFWQVLEVSKVPLIASHSSARHFTPGFERNMADDMIIALAKNGGVMQINFGSTFVTANALAYSDKQTAAGLEWLANNPQYEAADAYMKFPAIYAEEYGGMPFASLDDVLDHIDHVVSLTSIDHVGLGSDYDGVGDTLPTGLKDVAAYPNLIEGLLKRGYSEGDIRKILGENLLRVWQAAEDYAAIKSTRTYRNKTS